MINNLLFAYFAVCLFTAKWALRINKLKKVPYWENVLINAFFFKLYLNNIHKEVPEDTYNTPKILDGLLDIEAPILYDLKYYVRVVENYVVGKIDCRRVEILLVGLTYTPLNGLSKCGNRSLTVLKLQVIFTAARWAISRKKDFGIAHTLARMAHKKLPLCKEYSKLVKKIQ